MFVRVVLFRSFLSAVVRFLLIWAEDTLLDLLRARTAFLTSRRYSDELKMIVVLAEMGFVTVLALGLMLCMLAEMAGR